MSTATLPETEGVQPTLTAAMPAIRLEGVTKAFEGRVVLDDV